jgi:hypothetical protein
VADPRLSFLPGGAAATAAAVDLGTPGAPLPPAATVGTLPCLRRGGATGQGGWAMRAIVTAAARWAPWAERELGQRLPHWQGEVLAPGVWLLRCGGSGADLARTLAQTVFLRHIAPVQVVRPLQAGERLEPWVDRHLPGVLAALPEWPPAGPVQVQGRILPGGPPWPAAALASAIGARLRALGVEVVGGPAPFILSAVAGPQIYCGLAPRGLHLSPWPGGEVRLRRAPDEISRAARKLEEALLLQGGSLRPPTASAQALDLGAAPGGWSQLLLRHGWRVTAVDRAGPAPVLAAAPELRWIRGAAEAVPLPPGPFDLLTADLNGDPAHAAACVARFHACLRAGARGVCTIKFHGHDPLQAVAVARARLEAVYRVSAVRHLFHDRAEATAFLHA